MNKRISVVVPVYNEKDTIGEFLRRIHAVISSLKGVYDFEVILVDDGSSDGTTETMRVMTRSDPQLRVIELRRNYGQTAALQAGIDAALGDVVITMDADLQHFPEEIPKFLGKLEEGYDIVCGWRHQRAEGIMRRWPSRVANLLIRRISRVNIHDYGTTYRAYCRNIIKEMRLLGEFHRFIPAIGKDLGARITEIPIENIERPAGRSKYGIGRTTGVFLDMIVLFFFTRYMDRPMRAFGKIGMCGILFGSGILAVLIAYSYAYGISGVKERQGWFLMAIMCILASVQILMTGILAELLIRSHFAHGDRRVYRIRNEWRSGEPVA